MSEIDYKKLLYDKVKFGGVSDLDNCELLSLALDRVESSRNSSTSQLSQALEFNGGDISLMLGSNYDKLLKYYRLSSKTAIKLIAIGELAKRVKFENKNEVEIIRNSNDIAQLFANHFTDISNEEFWVVYLNNGNRVLERKKISDGITSSVLVDIKLIIRHALNILATKIILVHNHPSSALTPSDEDITLTNKITSAAQLFDIIVLDHIIFAPSGEYFGIFSES